MYKNTDNIIDNIIKQEQEQEYNEIIIIIYNYINNNDYIYYISDILVKEIIENINLNFSICPKDIKNYYIDYFIKQDLNDYYKNYLNDLIYNDTLDYINKNIIITNNYNIFIKKYINKFINKNYFSIRSCINNILLKYKN